MKKPLLAAFAAITLAAAPARATTFIKDVMLIGGTKSETTALKTSLVADGWTFIDYDLNKGASGDYIYLLYKGEEGADGLNRGYITGFYIKSGASDVNSEFLPSGRRLWQRLAPRLHRLERLLLVLYAVFGRFRPCAVPRLLFGRLRLELHGHPLHRAVCASSETPAR